MRIGIRSDGRAARRLPDRVGRAVDVAADDAGKAGAEEAARAIRRSPGRPGNFARARKVDGEWAVPYAGPIDRWLDLGTRRRRTRRTGGRGRIRARRFYSRAISAARGSIDDAIRRAIARRLNNGRS